MDLSGYGFDDEVKAFLNEQKDFIIDRVSQEGGNGDIFFGHHKILGGRIALKVYYGNDNSNSHYEPRILSTINHQNILKVHDAKRIGNYHSYFLTEEISGGDLEKFYKAGKLDLKESLNVIHGVLNGLTELHKPEISIVHRDLKPKNILIYNDSKQPLISDFGSVKHLDNDIGSVTGSKTTLIYTPKEVFESYTYTKQSDIYQVGVTMFQILGGFFPGAYIDWLTEKEMSKLSAITGELEQSVFIEKVVHKLVVRNKLLRATTLPKYIDQNIIKVINHATNPRLSSRYANTSRFMQDLYKIQKRVTNWKMNGDILTAIKCTGEEFRISPIKKGFVTEKKGSTGKWRRNGEPTSEIQPQITIVNSN